MALYSKLPVLVLLTLSSFSLPAYAGDGADWLSDAEELPKGVVKNENVMISKDSTPFSLTIQAERALKSGNYEKAIEFGKRALELNIDDCDSHLIYAKALEAKLAAQKKEDPLLFNHCVREWLYVLRNTYGDERGVNFRGLGLPGVGGAWNEDEDRQRPARQHLLKLTGCVPKLWETNEKFLKKVSRTGESSVSGKIISKDKDANESQPTAPAPKLRSSSTDQAH